MLDLNSDDLSFKTEKQVETYSKFFLGTSPINSSLEFKNQEEVDAYLKMREHFIKTQLGYLRSLDFEKANVTKIDAQYVKIVKEAHKKPLSSIGATKGSSRFNYKELSIIRNRAIYFGKSKTCCEIEKFHLSYQREMIQKAFTEGYKYEDGEIPFAKHLVKTYDVSIENVLVLTSKPSMDAIKVSQGAFMNEWYDINEEYDIPTSSQILGTIAKLRGYNGILYKSVRYQVESNLILFEENTGELNFNEVDSQEYNPSTEILAKGDL